MKIGGEEVEQVRSFDELRAGMIVWYLPCSECDSKHRMMLTREYSGQTFSNRRAQGYEFESGWLYLPSLACDTGEGGVLVSGAISGKRVFRVVNSSRDNKRRSKMKSGILPQSVTSK